MDVRTLRLLGAIAALSLVLAGCGDYSHLSFRQDKRLHILIPADRSTVRLPITIRWQIHDFTITGPSAKATADHGYFGLFVDRAPVPGGQTLGYIARDDQNCRVQDGCPNADYFAAHQVYSTSATHFTLDTLPNPNLEHQKETHTVTIVLLDSTGHRIGESAWSVTFTLQRKVL